MLSILQTHRRQFLPRKSFPASKPVEVQRRRNSGGVSSLNGFRCEQAPVGVVGRSSRRRSMPAQSPAAKTSRTFVQPLSTADGTNWDSIHKPLVLLERADSPGACAAFLWIRPLQNAAQNRNLERLHYMTIPPNLNVNPIPEPTVTWPGGNGAKYTFHLYPIGQVFYAVPGLYIFCRPTQGNRWQAIYVGETDNLWRRVTNELAAHHQWDAVRAHGATHICALRVDAGQAERLRIETDLRHSLNPPCNRQ
jgi:hypothetical protein